MCVFWLLLLFFFFKQKTAYEMRISDWSSDVCSSDLLGRDILERLDGRDGPAASLNRLEAAGARAITVTIIPGQRALDRVRAVDTAATAALRARDIPDRPADADQAPVSSPAPSPVRGGRDKDRDR